jgi:hypothetical protein
MTAFSFACTFAFLEHNVVGQGFAASARGTGRCTGSRRHAVHPKGDSADSANSSYLQSCNHAWPWLHGLCVVHKYYNETYLSCDIIFYLARRLIAAKLDLEEGTDFVRICLGGAAFYKVVQDLGEYANVTSKEHSPARFCDLSGSSMAATSARAVRQGLLFTRPVYRASIGALVYAPVKVRGIWAFFQPFKIEAWLWMAGVVLVVPLIVIFFELLFESR